MPQKQTTHNLLIEILGQVTEIKRDIADLKKFQTSTDATLANINDFIKRDADIIEHELNTNMMSHLQKTFEGYKVQEYGSLLKSISHPTKPGEKLTDFDGLYLLTSKDIKLSKSRIFVIVEAKRYTTLEKINKKIAQKNILDEMITIAKSGKFLLKKFQQTALTHKLNDITSVYLYIGGPYWEDGAMEALIKHEKTDSKIGHIKLAGSRYDFHDEMTYLHGGRKKTKAYLP